MKYLAIFAALVVTGLTLAGCDNDGPVEEAGEELGDAVEEIRSKTKSRTRRLQARFHR